MYIQTSCWMGYKLSFFLSASPILQEGLGGQRPTAIYRKTHNETGMVRAALPHRSKFIAKAIRENSTVQTQ